MIITCEKCDTRFKLDDDRIPAEGVKVRCSRCKHAFLAQKPESSIEADEAVADELARAASGALAEASTAASGALADAATPASGTLAEAPAPTGGAEEAPGAGGADTDDRTQALGALDTDERTRMLDQGSVDFGAADSDEESDWEFNEDPPVSEPGIEPTPPGPEIASRASEESAPLAEPEGEAPDSFANLGVMGEVGETRSADPMNEFLAADPGDAEPSIEDVGRPEEWDLLGDIAEEGGESFEEHEPAPAAVPEEADPGVEVAREDGAEPSVAEPVAVEAPVEIPDAADLGPAPSWLQRGARWLGGAAVAGLLGLAAWGSLVPRPTLAGGPVAASLGPLQAAEVRAHLVENALAGGLLVVSAELRNPGAAPRVPEGVVRVTLLDGSGRPIVGPEALLARAPSQRALRRESPERLIEAQRSGAQALARTPVAPGESIPVLALFAEAPLEARGFRFELAPGSRSGLAPGSSPDLTPESGPDVTPESGRDAAPGGFSSEADLPSPAPPPAE